jgi:hypothetical protein
LLNKAGINPESSSHPKSLFKKKMELIKPRLDMLTLNLRNKFGSKKAENNGQNGNQYLTLETESDVSKKGTIILDSKDSEQKILSKLKTYQKLTSSDRGNTIEINLSNKAVDTKLAASNERGENIPTFEDTTPRSQASEVSIEETFEEWLETAFPLDRKAKEFGPGVSFGELALISKAKR